MIIIKIEYFVETILSPSSRSDRKELFVWKEIVLGKTTFNHITAYKLGIISKDE